MKHPITPAEIAQLITEDIDDLMGDNLGGEVGLGLDDADDVAEVGEGEVDVIKMDRELLGMLLSHVVEGEVDPNALADATLEHSKEEATEAGAEGPPPELGDEEEIGGEEETFGEDIEDIGGEEEMGGEEEGELGHEEPEIAEEGVMTAEDFEEILAMMGGGEEEMGGEEDILGGEEEMGGEEEEEFPFEGFKKINSSDQLLAEDKTLAEKWAGPKPKMKKGAFGDWCKDNGFKQGTCQACINKAAKAGGHPAKMALAAANMTDKYTYPGGKKDK